jgi:outer membrane protein assembly factor BamB
VTQDLAIVEYTRDGRGVRSVMVPPDGTPGDVGDELRDIVGDLCGTIYAYQGTFVPHVAIRPYGGEWRYLAIPGFSTVNNVSYGGIAVAGQYAFATDMFTYSGGEPAGVIRFSLADGTGERFGSSETEDLNVGLDGVLYTLAGETLVERYQPQTMNALGTINLSRAVRGIAVSADGFIYGASWDGGLYEFDAQGALLHELQPGLGSLSDIDIAEDGTLVASTRSGLVVVSSRALENFSSFNPSGVLYSNQYTFVTFVR